MTVASIPPLPAALCVHDSDLVMQKCGHRPSVRADLAAQQLAFARLFDPVSTRFAAGRHVTVQDHLPTTIDDIFLNVIVGVQVRMRMHDPAAVRTMGWRRHVDDFVPPWRLGTEPSGMSEGSSPLLAGRRGCGRRFLRFVLRGTILAESLLPFGLQFPLKLLHLLLEPFILGNQGGNGSSFCVQLPVKHLDVFALIVGGQNEAAKRSTSQVRTVPDMRAPVLVLGVKDEFHRPPFRREDVIPYANTAFKASPAWCRLGGPG